LNAGRTFLTRGDDPLKRRWPHLPEGYVHDVVMVLAGIALLGAIGYGVLVMTFGMMGDGPISNHMVKAVPTSGSGVILLDWEEEATSITALGNATGRQYISFIDVSGNLWAATSEDLQFNDTNRSMLKRVGPGAWALELGYLENRSVGLRLSLDTPRYQWILKEWPNGWIAFDGELNLSYPPVQKLTLEGIPYKDQAYDYRFTFSAVSIAGTPVVTGAYSAPPHNGYRFPCLVFRRADGQWSNIVTMGHFNGASCNPVTVGTSLTDLFVVTCNNNEDVAWYVYFFRDGALVDAGNRQLDNP